VFSLPLTPTFVLVQATVRIRDQSPQDSTRVATAQNDGDFGNKT